MDLNELSKHPEQIQSLISLLQGLLDSTSNAQSIAEQAEEKEIESNTNTKIKTRGPRKPKQEIHINKFEKMSEYNMHKDDVVVDKMLSSHPPVARMREFEMVDVVCRICGKKETVNPALVFDSVSRYKCNNCSTQAG